MRELLDERDRRNVQGVAGVSLKGLDAALADDDFVIAAGHQVLGRKQRLFNRRRRAAFEQNWLVELGKVSQQIVILHVARADLQNVYVTDEERNLLRLHDFGNRQQAV